MSMTVDKGEYILKANPTKPEHLGDKKFDLIFTDTEG